MILLNLLRMMVDLSCYGTFASIVSSLFGGTGVIAGMLIQCLFFGLSVLGGSHRWLRMLLTAPILALWIIYGNNPADAIFLIPGTFYIAGLVWRNDYILQYGRQVSLFQGYWKIFLLMIPFLLIFDAKELLLTVILPYGLFMIIPSVLLMQMLRHDKQVYCSPGYQMINYVIVAALSAIALILSSDTFLQGCRAVVSFLYRTLIRPLLYALTNVLEVIVWLFYKLFSSLFNDSHIDIPIPDAMGASPALEQIPGQVQTEATPNPWLTVIFWSVLAVILITVLIIFFRFLNRHDPEVTSSQEQAETHSFLPSNSRRTVRNKESSELHKIRAQYKQFLKWCTKHGIHAKPCHTSEEIHQQISHQNKVASAELRDIYIRARYAGRTTVADARQMKKLFLQLKRSTAEMSETE